MAKMMSGNLGGNMRPKPHSGNPGQEKKVDQKALNQAKPSTERIGQAKIRQIDGVPTYKPVGEGRAFDHKPMKTTKLVGKEDGGGDHMRKEHPIDYTRDRGPHQHKGGKYKV